MKNYSLEYDDEADAGYIRVRKGKVSETIEVDKDTLMDVDRKKRVVGFEILNISKRKINLGALVLKLENVVSIR